MSTEYDFVERLGEGGFGFVDKVRGSDGNLYARKTFSPKNVGGDIDDLLKRFRREVKSQIKVGHKNIVPVLDHDLTANPPWFVMPLAEQSFQDWLIDHGSQQDEVRLFLLDTLNGLEVLHKQGYKHRDLNPKNILRFTDGENISYKVSDLGLVAPPDGKTTTLTMTGTGAGTPFYQPPECVRNFKKATNQSDIYSFGAILHDIFGNGSRIPHTPLSVPGPLKEIVEKCTEKNPKRRYNSVSSLRDALIGVLEQDFLAPTTDASQAIVELISKDDSLTDEEWDRVCEYVDDVGPDSQESLPIFQHLTVDRIAELHASAPEIHHALGGDFADHMGSLSFPFDYCDVLARKADAFLENADTEIAAKLLLGMLELGTRHNRWFVMRKFARHCSGKQSKEVIERMVTEAEMRDSPLNDHLARLVQEVDYHIGDLNPKLLELARSP